MAGPSDLQLKLMNAVHRAAWKISGGRLLSNPFGMPAVELHTVGRKTGQPRTSILTAPIHDDTRTVLVASKGGSDQHPAWYLNLTAQPDIELTIAGERRPFRARTASADERAELWRIITKAYKGYAGYQTKTDREIPVVICEPR